jgi:hypothetical protein
MPTSRLICKYSGCGRSLGVYTDDSQSTPILFCSNECFNSFLLEIRKLDHELGSEDPKEVKEFVKDLMNQVDVLQKDIRRLGNIRRSYFDIFNEDKLKKEDYKRKWSFMDKEE